MFNFPWTNFHELNLDWILSVVKEAKEVFDNGRSDIDYAVSTADEAKEIATQAAEASIPDNSVSTQKIQDYAVNADKLSNYSVTEAKLQNAAVTTAKIADGAVTSAKIADGTITGTDIADATITKPKLTTAFQTSIFTFSGAFATGTDCNNIELNSIVNVWASATNSPGFVGVILCVGTAADIRQIAFAVEAPLQIKTRRYNGSTWSSWVVVG